MRGVWYTTDSGARGGGLVVLVIAAAVLFGSAAAAIATAVLVAVIALAVVVVLAVAGLGAWLAYRLRHDRPAGLAAPLVRQLPAQEQATLEAGAPRELHLHFHGIGAEQAAEIIQKGHRP